MNFESLYFIIDEILRVSSQKQNVQVQMNDSEIIFAYLIILKLCISLNKQVCWQKCCLNQGFQED
jgi:hypothetical protein